MRLRDLAATTVGALALLVPASAMGDTLIGNFANGNVQGADSSQSGVQGASSGEFSGPGPVKFVDGDSAPHLSQTSTNVADNTAIVGGPGGDGAVIGNGSQANSQAINSLQVAKKGTQVSTNVESGTQVIGLTAGDAIIGSPTQVSDQGENSVQTAASKPGAVTTLILGPTNKAPLTETSGNILISCEAVIGPC